MLEGALAYGPKEIRVGLVKNNDSKICYYLCFSSSFVLVFTRLSIPWKLYVRQLHTGARFPQSID